jgi:hypothetical protein
VEALGRWDAIPATINGMATAPARTGTRWALWQQRQHCGACGNGMPPYLPLCLVRTDVSNSLEPVKGHHGRLPPFYPRSRHCSGTRHAMMAGSLQESSGRPPTLQHSKSCSLA